MATSSYSIYTAFKAKDGVSGVLKNMKNNAAGFGFQLTKLKNKAETGGNSMSNSFGKIKAAIGIAATAIATSTVLTTLNKWVDAASDLQETLGKTNETFKTNSKEVIDWSKNSIKAMGLAQQTALDTAALYGDMGSGMGMTTKRAAEMAMSLTQLSADIASFKNVDQSLSANALKGIFTGETEALKNLGVVMTETNLTEYAKSKGIGKKLKDMTQAEKIELRYDYVLKSTKNAQGDFLRTGGNFANQQRMFQEQQKQLETNLGAILLPQYNAIMKQFNALLIKYSPAITEAFRKMFTYFKEGVTICSPLFGKFVELVKYFKDSILPGINNSLPVIKVLLQTVVVPSLILTMDAIKGIFAVVKIVFDILGNLFNFVKNNWLPLLLTLPLAIAGVKVAIDILRLKMALLRMEGGLLAVVMNTKLITAITGLTGAVWKSVAALYAQAMAFFTSPIGLIVLGVGALVGVTILLWKNWDKVTAAFMACWNCIKPGLLAFWETCKSIFSQVGIFIKTHFIDILLLALGPVGLIIRGVMKIGGAIKNLKNGGGVQLEGANGQSVQNNAVQKNPNAQNGKIDVGVKIDNSTMFPASSTLNLQGSNGLNLTPAY